MKFKTKIQFVEGLHSRPAMKLTDLSRKYQEAKIKITKVNEDDKNINCNSLISILTSNIKFNDEIVIEFNENEKILNELQHIFK